MDNNLELGKRRAEELGLLRDKGNSGDWYRADDIHQLLGEGTEWLGKPDVESGWSEIPDPRYDTHKALLIGIRPIVQESEERKFLRECLEYLPLADGGQSRASLVERIKRLLERKGDS